MQVLSGGKVPVKIWTDDVESSALNQLRDLARMDFIHKHVAVMPDVHSGIGSTIGTVLPTVDVIIPAAVGVDIGCGMNAVKLSLTANDLPDNLHIIRQKIEDSIPLAGTGGHGSNVPPIVSGTVTRGMYLEYEKILDASPELSKKMSKAGSRWIEQLGTLGSGNHFIEICIDESNNVWVMLHSGSRGIGNAIGTAYIDEAKKQMEKWMINLPNSDLAYLPRDTQSFENYMFAMNWAQDYALKNREIMMKQILRIMKACVKEFEITDEGANCHHNYVSLENHFGKNVYVTRKGAVRARKGDIGIIPGSMGAKSYIVRGLGNEQSFCSCSHGAGRVMSRSKAKSLYSNKDVMAQTEGVECRKDSGVIDEIPSAYKDIDQVMENQKDLVEILHTLKQVVCVKG